MRKIFTFISAVVLALSMQAATLDTVQVKGIYYQINAEDSIASVIRYDKNFIYDTASLVIPVNVVKDNVSYPIKVIAQAAFAKSTASSIAFAKGSKVDSLGMQAFQAAVNLEELELPEGVKMIPTTCIHNATASAPMTMKKLVFPASLDSLCVMAIALPQLKILKFKGATPPSIATKVTATWTQNPWQISATHANNTAKTAKVLVPAGAVEAYRNTAWIGDYFTTILQEKDTLQENGLYFELDNETQTATLIRLNANSKYEMDTIVIPVSVSKEDRVYPVVALGQGALRNTTAKAIIFAEGSQVKELGMQAFQGAVNLQELELPEGIKLIPLTGIHNATASSPMQIKKLVLPSTVDSLALFSICLPQLDTLVFKGTVPPSIATKKTATWTQNPWQISTTNVCNTAKTAVVVVPEGAVEAYSKTAWIGDYFYAITDKKVAAATNIAGFNALPDGVTVNLQLTNAKVTAYADLQGVYYVEDATAATVVKGTALTVGTALNGVIVGTKSIEDVDYMNTPSQAYEHKLTVTDATGVSATEAELTPTVMTIAEACAQANYAKLITIENVTAAPSGKNMILTDANENTIKSRDLFGVLSAEFEWPEAIESITGICLYYMNGWYIIPTSEEGIVAKEEQGVEDVEVNGKAVKFLENGQLYIMYKGVKYNVQGMIIR